MYIWNEKHNTEKKTKIIQEGKIKYRLESTERNENQFEWSFPPFWLRARLHKEESVGRKHKDAISNKLSVWQI